MSRITPSTHLLHSLRTLPLRPQPHTLTTTLKPTTTILNLPRQSTHTQRRHATAVPPPGPDAIPTPARIPQPQSRYHAPQSLLHRRPASDRALPTLAALSSTRRWLRTLPIFIAVITLSALGLFNYQKVNSPIISANLYALRTNPAVREILGDEVYFASKWAWVWGSINLVQGRVDVTFEVKGRKRRGWCRFRARRFGGKGGSWRTEEWGLRLPNQDGEGGERVVDLLEGERGDPMGGVSI